MFGKNKKKNIEEVQDDKRLSCDLETLVAGGHNISEDVALEVIRYYCGQMCELQRQKKDSETEYSAVSLYLSDIELIEEMEPEKRQKINEIASRLVELNSKRLSEEIEDAHMNPEAYARMEKYRDGISGQMKKLMEMESHHKLIQGDLHQLDGEKGVINYEKSSANEKKVFLRKMAIISIIIVSVLFILLGVIGTALNADVLIPVLLTALMSMIIAAYISVSYTNAVNEIKLSEVKRNRLIKLINTIKIKYVNSKDALDFMYSKYGVSSCDELINLYNEYRQEKSRKEKIRHERNETDTLDDMLTSILDRQGVSDSQVWIYQPEAIADSKEMVEVRHRLNTRRSSLRNQTAQLEKQYEDYEAGMKRIIENGKYAPMAKACLDESGITFS